MCAPLPLYEFAQKKKDVSTILEDALDDVLAKIRGGLDDILEVILIQGADLAFMLWPYRRVFKTPLQLFKEQGRSFFSSIHAQNHSVLSFHHAAPHDAGHSFP